MLALQIALGFAIALLMPIMAYYATCSIFPRPRSGDFRDKVPLRDRENRTTYQEAEDTFQKRLFVTTCAIGFCSLVSGPFLPVKAVGAGLMIGGILSIMEGAGVCWRVLNPKMKFAFLLFTIVVLIAIGYHSLS